MLNLKRKINNKRYNAITRGVEFHLTEDQILFLLTQAGITEHDWCIRGYDLARFDDKGHYVLGNCRFIKHYENIAERKTSEKARMASKQNIKIAIAVKLGRFV